MHNRFQGSFCCDLPLQDLNLVSASGGMVTGWNSHQPKIFVFKSSTQQQSCKAHEIGQFCHQDHPSICLCSKVRDRAMTAFQLAPKWWKAAKGRFCKFGSFPPHLTHRQLDWSTKMFFESPFHGYPTCLIFAQMVLMVGGTVNSKNNKEEKTREDADIRIYHISWHFSDRMW